MATERDAQTLLSGYRTKFPRYKDVDDATLLGAIQKKYPAYKDVSLGVIPKTENFLQKAIRVATHDVPAVGAGLVSPLPELSRQLSKAPLAGPMQFAAGMAEKEPAFNIPHATTEIGKKAEAVAPYVPLAIGGTKLAISGGKGIGKFIGRVASDPKEFAYTAGKAVESARSMLLSSARDKFGQAFKNITSTMVRSDFDDVVLKSVDDIAEGSQEAVQQMSTIPSSDVSKLFKLSESVPENVTLTKEFIQAKYAEIYKGLSERGKAIFLKHFSDNIKGTAQGLAEAKKAIAPVYKIAKGKTPITETNIRMVASGKVPKSKMADLIAKESEIGTSYVKEAKDIAGAKKFGKNVSTVAGVGTGLEFLRRLFNK